MFSCGQPRPVQGTDLCSQELTGALALRLTEKRAGEAGQGGPSSCGHRGKDSGGRAGFHGLLFWPAGKVSLALVFALAEVKERTVAGAGSLPQTPQGMPVQEKIGTLGEGNEENIPNAFRGLNIQTTINKKFGSLKEVRASCQVNPILFHGGSGHRSDLLRKHKNELVADSGRNPGVGLRGVSQPSKRCRIQSGGLLDTAE